MLSHLGRNVVLSRPISLLDIKDDDNGNLKQARQLPRRGVQPPPAAAASEVGGIAARRRRTAAPKPLRRGRRRWKVTKTKSSKWDLSHLH
jgi:hypothetical protein